MMEKPKKTARALILSVVRRTAGVLRETWLLPVKLYRKVFSPLKRNPTCRFYPTCSAYAIDAVRRWGIILGTVLAVWRVLRCNPFSDGGFDPVPAPPWENNDSQTDGERRH